MQDPILNRNLEETKELMVRWSQFHEFFKLGVRGENITPQAELKFLELKTRIAMLHDGFLQSVRRDPKIAQNVIGVMAACIMLRRLPGLNKAELQKLEYDWNEAFLLMTETIAQLEQQTQELLLVSEGGYRFQQFRKRVTRAVGGWMRHPLFLIGAILFAFALGIAGLPALGVYDLRSIKRTMPFTARVYDPVVGVLRVVFSDIPYEKLGEITLADARYGKPDRGSLGSMADRLEPKDFINQLVNRGFDVNDVDQVTRLFNRRLDYRAEVYVDPNGYRLVTHEVLFDTTHDAIDFIRLRRAGLDKASTDLRYRVGDKYTVCRKSNHVVILEGSDTAYRRTFAEKRWGFGSRQIDI